MSIIYESKSKNIPFPQADIVIPGLSEQNRLSLASIVGEHLKITVTPVADLQVSEAAVLITIPGSRWTSDKKPVAIGVATAYDIPKPKLGNPGDTIYLDISGVEQLIHRIFIDA